MNDIVRRFVKLRPYLYHLTAQANLRTIRSKRTLFPARDIFLKAGKDYLVTTKRKASIDIPIGTEFYNIRDQRPLYEGNIDLQDGWTFEDLLEALNRRVFFWPGTESRPIDYGLRHFERYKKEKPAILRLKTEDVFKLNALNLCQACRFNSGSPRCFDGKGSPRGPETFISLTQWMMPVGDIKELVYLDGVALPESTQYSIYPEANWKPLL